MHLSSRASLFADDTSLSKHISDYDTDNGELQNDLNIIENWAKQWKVKFNPLKSDALLISRRLKVHRYSFSWPTKSRQSN